MNIFKKIIFGFIIGFMIISFPIYSKDYNSPVDYMNELSQNYEQISVDMWEYVKTAAHAKSAFKVEAKRKVILKTVKKSIKTVGKIPDYKGDDSLQKAVLEYLNLLYLLLAEDYAKIVDMEEVAEQSYDLMEAYILAKEQAGEKMNDASDKLVEKVKLFAKNNNVNLIDSKNEINENLEKASQVMNYYNKIYLIFFKSSKQEMYLILSLEKADINDIEQNRSALLKNSTDGLKEMKRIKAYDGDSSVKDICIKLLKFYKDEAENKSLVFTDFHMKRELFEKIKKSVDSKKKKDLTQSDIDKYNEKANEMNEAGKKYNEVNNELNQQRQILINEWNNTASVFIDSHVPE